MATAHLTHECNSLAITMNDQGARGSQTSWQLQRPAPAHWSSLPLDPSLAWDHPSDTASNTMTASHHHQDGYLIPLLPCYYWLDFNCFVNKVGNLVPDGAVIFINTSKSSIMKHHIVLRYIQISLYLHPLRHSQLIWYLTELPSNRTS